MLNNAPCDRKKFKGIVITGSAEKSFDTTN